MTTPKPTKKSGYAYATEKLAKKEEELTNTQVVLGGGLNLLANNTAERNTAQANLASTERKLQENKNKMTEMYYKMLGRLIPFEDKNKLFEEALTYAFEESCFYSCDSKDLDIYSQIADYTTKTTKQTYKAHFTIYGKFIQKCKTPDEKPISYKGYFLMKNYKDFFEPDFSKEKYEKMTDFIKIKSKPEPEPAKIVIPEPIKIAPAKSLEWKRGEKITESFQLGLGDNPRFLDIYKFVVVLRNPDGEEFEYLHPRWYNKEFNYDYGDWIRKFEDYWFIHPETKLVVRVQKDKDITKRKNAKKREYGLNIEAENFLSVFGFEGETFGKGKLDSLNKTA